MTGHGHDHRLGFSNFIVGTANRLAAAAAKRVAESPGRVYNPLFIYGASGLGKTHLLTAIGDLAQRQEPHLNVFIDTAERALSQPPDENGESGLDGNIHLLLLDDVQTLSGDQQAQDRLLAWWDELSANGAQIVLAADRPPSEIDQLDRRLLSRFSAGLVADIAPPDYATRVAMVRRKAEDRGHTLGPAVAESIAHIAFADVRELEGGLNRVIAAQELDGRPVQADDVAALLGAAPERHETGEFDSFRSEIAGAVAKIATRMTPEQRLVTAILRFEGEGYRTYRLEAALRQPPDEREVIEIVEKFTTDVERLAGIMNEIRALDPEAPELARADLLRNPDRVLAAETLVAQVRERLRPLPEPPPGPGLDELSLALDSPALAAARAVARRPGGRVVPLYIRGTAESGRSTLLESLAREARLQMPRLPIALVSAPALAAEAAEAEREGHMAAWRGRYRRARLLIMDDFDSLEAQTAVRDELCGLFDSIRRSGGQIVLAGERHPTQTGGVTDQFAALVAESDVAEISIDADGGSESAFFQPGIIPDLSDVWFLDREKALERWPRVEDWLVTELD